MRRFKYPLLFLVLAALGATAFVSISFFRGRQPIPVPSSGLSEKASMGLKEAHFTEVKEGVKQWEIRADVAHYFKDRNLAELTNVTAWFYGKGGKDYSIRGDEATYNSKNQQVDIRGNVEARSTDGFRLSTGMIQYSGLSRRITAPDRVVIESPGFRVEGRGMVIELDKEKFQILNEVMASQR